MLEKLCWVMLYGIRGSIYAVPFILLSLFLFLISGNLAMSTATNAFTEISAHISNGIKLIGWGCFFTALIIWVATWIDDYQLDYLPNWIKKELY